MNRNLRTILSRKQREAVPATVIKAEIKKHSDINAKLAWVIEFIMHERASIKRQWLFIAGRV